ncbi:MAG: MlaD family protein, partial [Gammaproteobacteria bacterium]|nr:MlaD family protein [Gammaproteobacteria bacterium]
RVTDIHIDRDDYTAVVELTIGSNYDNLPTDTSAAILTAGLLGAQYVGLEPGGDDVYLKGGDRITLTQSAVILEQLIGQLVFSQARGGAE